MKTKWILLAALGLAALNAAAAPGDPLKNRVSNVRLEKEGSLLAVVFTVKDVCLPFPTVSTSSRRSVQKTAVVTIRLDEMTPCRASTGEVTFAAQVDLNRTMRDLWLNPERDRLTVEFE